MPLAIIMLHVLTIDLAAGDRWLIDICQKATKDWLKTTTPFWIMQMPWFLHANQVHPAAIASWQEHVDGKPQYAPPIPSLASAKFTGGLWLVAGRVIQSVTVLIIHFKKAQQTT
jgi:hypothetical protein